MSGFRKQRVAEQLLGFLGGELRRLNDPRLAFVTLTGVDIAPDLKSAKVFWSLLTVGETAVEFPDKKSVQATEEALKKAKPVLKKRIGRDLKLRYTPELFFLYDSSIQYGSRIDELLDEVKDDGN